MPNSLLYPINMSHKNLWLPLIGLYTVVLLAIAMPSIAQPANNRYQITLDADSNTVALKILAWNVYMLPARTFMHTGQISRAAQIADTLSQTDYDLIVMTEAFHPKARRILAKGLCKAFPYQTEVGNRRGGIKTNSGIWVVSRLPLTLLGEIRFDDCAGSDCWARKGAMLVQTEKNGQKVQILGTHLQADEGSRRDTVRSRQYRAIHHKLLLPNQQNGVLQIIAGDMNTTQSTHAQMLRELDAIDGKLTGKQQTTWTTDEYSAPNAYLFDYILLRPNARTILGEKRYVTEFKKTWTHRRQTRQQLSDHYGVALEVLLGD